MGLEQSARNCQWKMGFHVLKMLLCDKVNAELKSYLHLQFLFSSVFKE